MGAPRWLKGMLGCAGVLTWLGLFAAGMMIDSKPLRDQLRAGNAGMETAAAVAGAAPGPAVVPPKLPIGPAATFRWNTFLAAILVYTPLNIALLTLLAGCVGGCASNITHDPKVERAVDDAKAVDAERLIYLTENPFASMLRSFVVYLGMIAGSVLVANDPFAEPTAEQYLRIAGTLSLFAFVVGYDPTRFRDFLN